MVNSAQRERLLEEHRFINVEYDDWWDCIESDFREDMRKIGINVNRIYFSGFWSQGDGACFEGTFDNVRTYLDHHHKDQYPMIRKLLDHGGYVYAECKHSGRYYHENCTEIIVVASERFYHLIECPTEFHEQISDQWDKLLDDELAAFEQAVIDQWRGYMQDLYRKLESEYDYLTSDEAVWEAIEAIEANELEEAA